MIKNQVHGSHEPPLHRRYDSSSLLDVTNKRRRELIGRSLPDLIFFFFFWKWFRFTKNMGVNGQNGKLAFSFQTFPADFHSPTMQQQETNAH